MPWLTRKFPKSYYLERLKRHLSGAGISDVTDLVRFSEFRDCGSMAAGPEATTIPNLAICEMIQK